MTDEERRKGNKIAAAKWKAANPGRVKALYRRKKAEINARSAAWQKNHPERAYVFVKNWRAKNPNWRAGV